jgi:hypothetical protein
MTNDEAMTNDKTQGSFIIRAWHSFVPRYSSFVIASAGNVLVYAQTECLSS